MRVLCTVSRAVGAAVAGVVPAVDLWAEGNVFVCGGYDGSRRSNRIHRFDPAGSGTWRPMPPMSVQREATAAAVVSGYLFVCGGFDGTRRLSAAERLDPATGTW